MKHQFLYAMIPPVSGCIPGCSDCCGAVPMSEEEIHACTAKAGAKPSIKKGLRCGYAVHGKCSVYECRPLTCRLYGAVSSKVMVCPHGAKAEHPLSQEQEQAILYEYGKDEITFPQFAEIAAKMRNDLMGAVYRIP